MKILFTFEDVLPRTSANAEVFVSTARRMAPLVEQAWLHAPVLSEAGRAQLEAATGTRVLRATAPRRPAVLRHICCGLTLPLRHEFRQADLVYTRNLWIVWLSLLFRRHVVFDHYRPWTDQIPPLQHWVYRLICNPGFLLNICHSEYTVNRYMDIGVPRAKLRCVHNGFDPGRLPATIPVGRAKQSIGVEAQVKTVVYTGRLNHKKGLELVIEAARRLPDVLFLLVGSEKHGPIERLAEPVANVRVVRWQPPEALWPYICAADCLLIPPSTRPLAQFGSTVLPLKVFFYLACGRAIIAGDTPDIREVLTHGANAFLCQPDKVDALVGGIRTLMDDSALRERLGRSALADSRAFTWDARAREIVAIVTRRLRDGSSEPGSWGERQRRAWRRQSWRWLRYLVSHRSWVLPATATHRPPPARVGAPLER